MMSENIKQPIIGLALSGGGMRGAAHISILKALDEYGLSPTIISGTSAGAFIGALYAAGIPPKTLMEITLERKFFPRSAFRFRTNGIFSTKFLLDIISEFIPEDDFKCLKIPLIIATTELSHGKIEYFSEGPLYNILLASCSIPYLFPPFKMNNKLYVDGGIMNNLPIEPLKHHCNFLIGSHVNSIEFQSFEKYSLIKELDRIIHLSIGQSVKNKSKKCNIFFDPPGMMHYSILERKKIKEIFVKTYDYAGEFLENLGYTKPL